MEIISNDLFNDLLNLSVKILPLVIAGYAVPAIIRIVTGSAEYFFSDIDVNIFTKPDIQEVKEPEKPKETVVKTYVINSTVKMEPASKTRDIPKRCPYCWGIPDNGDCCQYCGSKF